MILEIMEEGRIIWNDDVLIGSAVENDDQSDGGAEGGGDGKRRWLEVGTIIGEVYDDDDDDEDEDDDNDDRCGGKEEEGVGKREREEWSWQAYTHDDDH
jgi:hypothetical protein